MRLEKHQDGQRGFWRAFVPLNKAGKVLRHLGKPLLEVPFRTERIPEGRLPWIEAFRQPQHTIQRVLLHESRPEELLATVEALKA
jgi:hypothetical protein